MTTDLRVIIPTWNQERAGTLVRQLDGFASTRPSPVISTVMPEEGNPGSGLLLHLLELAFKADSSNASVLMALHDDVEVNSEGWDRMTLAAFDDPRVGLVGWGGATGLGHKDIYKLPYQLQQLARENYASATTDWKEHGEFLSQPREVAVLDGFCLAFRREAYEEMGGWQKVIDLGITFHGYDLASCLMMRRLGWKIMAVPVPCRHLGGRTSTTPEYQELLRSLGYQDDLEVHRKAHRLLYNEFRSELPVRV
jgi:hypothetical protein